MLWWAQGNVRVRSIPSLASMGKRTGETATTVLLQLRLSPWNDEYEWHQWVPSQGVLGEVHPISNLPTSTPAQLFVCDSVVIIAVFSQRFLDLERSPAITKVRPCEGRVRAISFSPPSETPG